MNDTTTPPSPVPPSPAPASPFPSTPDHPRRPTPPDGLLDQLAIWLEHRLDETVGWRHSSRLYGITVLDRDALLDGADDAARLTFLAQGWVYDLLASPSAAIATQYDALALCCFGRATNLETLERARCRTILVADATGQSSMNRLRGHEPVLTGWPTGPVADAVAALFGTHGAADARSHP